jgi:hypothetical protein
MCVPFAGMPLLLGGCGGSGIIIDMTVGGALNMLGCIGLCGDLGVFPKTKDMVEPGA